MAKIAPPWLSRISPDTPALEVVPVNPDENNKLRLVADDGEIAIDSDNSEEQNKVNQEHTPLEAQTVTVATEPLCDDAQESFLPAAMAVAGLEHVANNMLHDTHTKLSCWESFYSQLRNLSKLLTAHWRRERFLSSCLSNSPLVTHAGRLQRWSQGLYEHRWHHVLLFLKALIPVLSLLTTFSAKKYLAHGAGGEGSHNQSENGPAAFKAEWAEQTVKDPFFHAYARMIESIDSIPSLLASWSKSCPCHDVMRKGRGHNAISNLMALHYKDHAVCPLQGMRAPEMASGAVQQLIEGFVSESLYKVCALDSNRYPSV